MAILRFIFAILFAPVRWAANLLTQHKDNVLEWHLSYGPYFVKIQTKHKEQFLDDDLLIASYILFLSRYFYICDERQINVVREFLFEIVKESPEFLKTAEKLHQIIFGTLNSKERDAVVKLSYIWGRIGPGFPPMTYSEDKEQKHSFAKYSFLVFERAGSRGLSSVFRMSAGPDIILLPFTVGILYDYVVNKMHHEDNKNKLDRSIIDLLEAYNSVDCRSLEGLYRLPVAILQQNNLKI